MNENGGIMALSIKQYHIVQDRGDASIFHLVTEHKPSYGYPSIRCSCESPACSHIQLIRAMIKGGIGKIPYGWGRKPWHIFAKGVAEVQSVFFGECKAPKMIRRMLSEDFRYAGLPVSIAYEAYCFRHYFNPSRKQYSCSIVFLQSHLDEMDEITLQYSVGLWSSMLLIASLLSVKHPRAMSIEPQLQAWCNTAFHLSLAACRGILETEAPLHTHIHQLTENKGG